MKAFQSVKLGKKDAGNWLKGRWHAKARCRVESEVEFEAEVVLKLKAPGGCKLGKKGVENGK